MKEIIHCYLGKAGANIYGEFLEKLLQEHGLQLNGCYAGDSDLQFEKIEVFFNYWSNGAYKPRSILINSDACTLMDEVQSNLGQLTKSQNMLRVKRNCSQNWAKGYYQISSQIIDDTMNILRVEAENCESLQGFQITHSIGGGFGSSFSIKLSEILMEEYPNQTINSFSVFPSQKEEQNIIFPYNSVLSIYNLTEKIKSCNILDNQGLEMLLQNGLQDKKKESNKLIASAMSGATSSLRFSNEINSDLQQMITNLLPFPKLPYVLLGEADNNSLRALNFDELTNQAYNRVLTSAKPTHGKYISSYIIYRGRCFYNQKDLIEELNIKIQKQWHVDWNPNNCQIGYCDIPQKGRKNNATLIGNSTSTFEIFERILDQFCNLYKKKAFIHQYTQEGLEEMDLVEAASSLIDLIGEYQYYQHVSLENFD